MSTFHGLNVAKQALSSQQSALHTTEHNISNVNTDGYSRQRVNFQTSPPLPASGMSGDGASGQMGTGVETETVERIRNEFLDLQYRAENSESEFWDAKSESLSRLEELMNEPSDSGISDTMKQFWKSLQDLSVEPDSSGAKSVLSQRAEAFTNALNYTAESIESQRGDMKNEIDVDEEKVNSLISQIDGMNDQIKEVEARGDLPNDMYDERDNLIDELSGIVNVKVSYSESSDSAKDIADGLASIELADGKGNTFDEGAILLDGEEGKKSKLDVDIDSEAVSNITIGGEEGKKFEPEEFLADGSLKGNIESYGYMEDDEVQGTHPEMLQDLDKMTEGFVGEFNDFYTDEGRADQDFFTFDSANQGAHTVTVNEEILDDPDSIVASSGNDGEEYGDVAHDLAEVFDEPIDDLDDTSVNDYFESLVGDLGVMAQEANKMNDNAETLRSQADSKRKSESDVSLDEEMTNMMKFQHAYNAAARSMTTVDEALDTVINNMGLVGR